MAKSPMIDDCFLHDKDRLRHCEAIEILKDNLPTLSRTKCLPLNESVGRILAHEIIAPRNIPAYSNAAVDGYAYLHKSWKTTQGNYPVSQRIVAGDQAIDPVVANSVARIFTGAPIPPNVDTVCMQEDVKKLQQDGQDYVAIPDGLKKGANVRLAGEDVSASDIVIKSGCRLKPQDIAAIASCGIGNVEVYSKIRVALLSTGDEIIRPGKPFLAGNVYDSNHYMINALLHPLPVKITDLGVVEDDYHKTNERLLAASASHDIIISSGGASLGSEDHITKILEENGTRHLWQLAIKPGRPICFGQVNNTLFFGLPGNPVASFVCFLMYLYPSILKVGGGGWIEPLRYKIASGFEVRNKKPDRREFLRGKIDVDEVGGNGLQKFEKDGSGLIAGLRFADGLIELSEETTHVNIGDELNFIPFSEFGIS